MTVFGKYAQFYDSLYSDKDYRHECDLIVAVFKKFSLHSVKTILDLGCGTGNHAFILHKLGYHVTGVDRSQSMLRCAFKKRASFKRKQSIDFIETDIQKLKLGKKFDAAIMMFGVLSYQIKNKDILQSLLSVRRHLDKNCLFIFDTWFGPAVLHDKPADRVKEIKEKNNQIIRFAHTKLDTKKRTCTVHYKTWQIKDKKLVTEVEEDHPMRYFFPKEMKFFLESSNFKLLHLGSFPDWSKKPDKNSWNVIWVAQAI